ncbi:MAG: porin family protein [Sulfurifustis sp.]
MKKHRYICAIALVAGVTICAAAAAQESPLYFGLKAGQMDIDQSGFDTSSNFGLLLGYDLFRDVNGSLAIEAEYTRDISKGDVQIGAANGDWKIETLAAYGAYRTAGPIYLKAKAGYLSEDISVSGVSGTGVSGNDSGFSFGAGVGYYFNRKTGIEFEYTVIEQDVNFFSIGYFTHF